MDKAGIGIVGCGNISAKYIHSLTEIFTNTKVVALTDANADNAKLRAKQFGLSKICKDNAELFALPEVDIVAVLTTPGQHFAVAEASLKAGKHTYVEKPLSLNTADGARLVSLARGKGVMLSGAPDTILGAGMQTARKLLDDDWIGQPIASISHILTGGPESWHPNPAFLYHRGAGPLFDVAPYYVAGLSYLFGPVRSVMCSAKKTYDQRPITSQPLAGTMITVEVPTYLTGILNMLSGVICTIHHSFDVYHTRLDNRVEIYGTKGTLSIPTPCSFSGDILFRGKDDAEWSSIPPLFAYRSDCRGIGIAEMAEALLKHRLPRLGGDFIYHTLEVLEKLNTSAESDTSQLVASRFATGPAMDLNPVWGEDKHWNPSDYGIPVH